VHERNASQAVGEELRGKLDAAMDRELRSLDRELDLRTSNLVSEEQLHHTKDALVRYHPAANPPPTHCQRHVDVPHVGTAPCSPPALIFAKIRAAFGATPPVEFRRAAGAHPVGVWVCPAQLGLG
jgi:hypothetical protein